MDNYNIAANIRIRKIVLTDFRNIVHTEVDLPGGKLSEYLNGDSSILGVYGQNGSGKSSLIMAINALKTALDGSSFTVSGFASCIRAGCKYAKLEFELSSYNDKGDQFDIYYAFKMAIQHGVPEKILSKDQMEAATYYLVGDGSDNVQMSDLGMGVLFSNDKRMVIYDEVLQFASLSTDGVKNNKQILIDASEEASRASGKAFGNKRKYSQLTSNCKSNIDDYLLKLKGEAKEKSTSFIFLPKVIGELINGSESELYGTILRALSDYASNYLFVITTFETGTANMNLVLLLHLWIEVEDYGRAGVSIPIKMYGPMYTRKIELGYLYRAIEAINKVIYSVVPGLRIGIVDTGKTLIENDEELLVCDIVSERNGVRIPLSYESDGIRRIVSFLSIMIAVYNHPSVTLAIDEIDSGIFEYMLGELLSIMNESAKGQLIFTSHNLRPLEVLPYRNLLFTTINPENRFTKLEGISGNNNLRDSYFRSIILGSGKDAFYDATDTFNIEQAFYEAGLPQE